MSRPQLSILVVAYDIAARELPRTLRSLRADYQRGVRAEDYEILVLDNGSPRPVPPALAAEHGGPTARVHRLDPALASPMRAVNVGAGLARGGRLAVMIDGARLVSPGLVALALAAGRRDVLIAPTYHLGPDLQNRSVLAGYSPAAEDAALAALGWPDAPGSGERLWEIASFGGSQRFGLFEPPVESNFVVMSRAIFSEMGGYDEAFDLPGGGYGSADALRRGAELPGARWRLAAGEGTFHQLHGGTAANDADPGRFAAALARYEAQYRALRGGRPLGPAAASLAWVGAIPAAAVPFVQRSGRLSLERFAAERPAPPDFALEASAWRAKNDELRTRVAGLKAKLEEQRARAERWKAKAAR